MRTSGIVIDLPLHDRRPTPAMAADRNSRIRSAIDWAERVSSDRMLAQADAREIESTLPIEDHYAFRMALVDADIRVRTGAVNIVDREEPVVDGIGDASVPGTDAWNAIMPSELNDSQGGTTELSCGKPRRSEGAINNLDDLTVASVIKQAQGFGEGQFAVSTEQLVQMLNHALGLEYSQALRYHVYADSLRVAFREALAEEFESHAEEEIGHAKALSAKIVALGGVPAPQVQEPVRISPQSQSSVQLILRELWVREQEGIKFYRHLKDALGANIFVHYIEEVLTAEAEHSDELLRFGALLRSASTAPDSQAFQWAESYQNENQFEGLDKMGEGEFDVSPSLDRIAGWQLRADRVKRKTMFAEIPVWIEYEAGDIRKGVNSDGELWQRPMHTAYGFIPGTRGADGEPLDVYLGGAPSRRVFVVFQLKPNGAFDEEKVMIGFPDAPQAEAVYRSHYPNDGASQFGGIRELSLDSFEDQYCRDRKAASKKVPNPNPNGRAEVVTEEYAREFEQEHPGYAEKPLPNVDTSKVVSPVQQEEARDHGKAKELELQMWRLLGGPGFNPYQANVQAVVDIEARIAAEQYCQPDHGPLGSDGEVDHPVEDTVISHA